MMARDGAWCGSCAGGLGWVMTWRRARMVLLSTQGMDVPAIAKIACAKSKPADHDLPFPVLKLVEAGGVPGRRGGGRRHQPRGPAVLLREEGVSA